MSVCIISAVAVLFHVISAREDNAKFCIFVSVSRIKVLVRELAIVKYNKTWIQYFDKRNDCSYEQISTEEILLRRCKVVSVTSVRT